MITELFTTSQLEKLRLYATIVVQLLMPTPDLIDSLMMAFSIPFVKLYCINTPLMFGLVFTMLVKMLELELAFLSQYACRYTQSLKAPYFIEIVQPFGLPTNAAYRIL